MEKNDNEMEKRKKKKENEKMNMICHWLFCKEAGGEVGWDREWEGEKGERGRDEEKEGGKEIRIGEDREGVREKEEEDFHDMSLTEQYCIVQFIIVLNVVLECVIIISDIL